MPLTIMLFAVDAQFAHQALRSRRAATTMQEGLDAHVEQARPPPPNHGVQGRTTRWPVNEACTALRGFQIADFADMMMSDPGAKSAQRLGKCHVDAD